MKAVINWSILIILLGCKFVNGQTFNEILGRPTDSTMTVSFMVTDQQADVYWEYGTVSGSYPFATATYIAAINTPVVVDFIHLMPNTQYFYRTLYRPHGSSGSYTTGSEYTFHTQRAIGSTFTFDVEADEHLYDYGDVNLYKITLNNEAADNPDFMLSLGDIFGDDHYPWTITSHICDSLHYLYRSRLGTVCHSIPFYICLGNHEGEKDYYLDTMAPNNLAIWSTLWRKFYYPNPYPNNFYSGDTIHESYGVGEPQNYYAWTWGNALFVVLDVYRSDCYDEDTTTTPKPNGWDWTLGFTEYSWLKNTLENSTAKFKFVFAHHVSGESRGGIVPAHLYEWGGYNKTTGGTYQFATYRPGWPNKPIHQLFIDNGVNIFFQGHDHLFAHEVMDNVTYQEVPMAADSTYIKGMLANGAAYTADTIDASGHIRVTVSPTCVQVDYVRAFLPKDTLSGIDHNREVSFSYTIGTCSTTGVNEVKEENFFTVYPNPAKDYLTILLPKNSSSYQICLINSLGQTIQQTQSNQFAGQAETIDISSVRDGVYLLNVKTAKFEMNKKVIICR